MKIFKVTQSNESAHKRVFILQAKDAHEAYLVARKDSRWNAPWGFVVQMMGELDNED